MAHTEPATGLNSPVNEANPLHERINSDFAFHPPTTESRATMGAIREVARDFAHLIVNLTPAGREQSLALTNLEQVVFWANAAIARHE